MSIYKCYLYDFNDHIILTIVKFVLNYTHRNWIYLLYVNLILSNIFFFVSYIIKIDIPLSICIRISRVFHLSNWFFVLAYTQMINQFLVLLVPINCKSCLFFIFPVHCLDVLISWTVSLNTHHGQTSFNCVHMWIVSSDYTS